MNPSVQVAFISVLATTITTIGVVVSASISNRRIREKIANMPKENDTFDDRDILERILALIEENERKEKIIVYLRSRIKVFQKEIADLHELLNSQK